MPLLKVHISSAEAPANKSLLVKRLKEVMIEKLQINEKIGQVLLYETSPQFRAIYNNRSNHFVFIEVSLYPGISSEIKQDFVTGLVEAVKGIFKIDVSDINCCIQEIPCNNWYSGNEIL
ncbi:MAG: Tautomerase enzyme [Clostridia bacterium]|nr:Tautomerase enzyme [Clostridia bacterium]